MSSIVVKKRFGNEWTDVREFIRPNDFMVSQLVDSKAAWTIPEVWGWVLKNISYPYGALGGQPDRHHHAAYGMASLPIIGNLFASRKYKASDYWSFPSETLRDMMGDCEDSSFLLTSMLRRIDPGMAAYSTVGYFEDFGHVWTSVERQGEWLILDTTLTEVPQMIPTERSRPIYKPLFRFNDKDIVVVDSEFGTLPILHAQGKERAIQSWYSVLTQDYRFGV